MAHAANVVPWRVSVFYMVSAVLVSVIVPSSDSRLLGGSGAAASPFVIASADAGIKGVPDIINACMIIGILAIALECIYLPSRILRTMALQKLIPEVIADVDESGRPRWALLITGVVGVVLTYMSLSGTYLPTYHSQTCHAQFQSSTCANTDNKMKETASKSSTGSSQSPAHPSSRTGPSWHTRPSGSAQPSGPRTRRSSRRVTAGLRSGGRLPRRWSLLFRRCFWFVCFMVGLGRWYVLSLLKLPLYLILYVCYVMLCYATLMLCLCVILF